MRLATPLLLLLLCAQSAAAFGKLSPRGSLEMAEASGVAFQGSVLQVDKDTATVAVDQILHRTLAAKSVRVTPITLQECMGPPLRGLAWLGGI